MNKICPVCAELKSTTDFNKSSTAKDGYYHYCRDCSKKHFKAWVKRPAVIVPEGMKFCNSCKESKDKALFNYNKDGKDGLHSRCKLCVASRVKLRKTTDKDYAAKLKLLAAEYTRKTSDRANAKSAQRRAKRISTLPKWVDSEYEKFFLEEIHNLAKLREKTTGIKWHVDHIVPLTSDVVCGLHCSDNLQLLTATENLMKANYWWPDMW